MKNILLDNGLTVRFVNNSRRYFGDYHHVSIDVLCDVPVPPDHEAAPVLGSSATYRRTLTKMAIATSRMDDVIAELLRNFEKSALAYLSSSAFPEKFIRSEVLRRRKKNGFLINAYGS